MSNDVWADSLMGAHPAAAGPPAPETLAFVRHWMSLCPHGSQVKMAYCFACVAALIEFEVANAKPRWEVEFRARVNEDQFFRERLGGILGVAGEPAP